MASFTLFSGSTTARTLSNGEAGYIGQNGALAPVGVAISSSGSVDVAVLGSLHSGSGEAIDHDGLHLDLHIGKNGSAGALTTDTIDADFTSGVYISNDGYLYSGSDALDLRQSDGSGSIEINNSGVISGKSDAIVTDSGTATTRIVNTGEIVGGDGGIDQLSGDTFLFNHGSIIGQNYGYDGSADIDTVRNFGSIEGGVIAFGGNDVVSNRGTIDFVDLGDGDDTYNGGRGFVERTVKGNDGDDKLKGGADIDQFRGGDGKDDLRGRGGDDDLRGGNGTDALRGNRGDDFLKGEKGADTFIFAKNGGFDTVGDFNTDNEKLDLTALGLKGFGADVKDNIHSAKNGSVVDLADDYGLTIFLKGVNASDLDGTDFIL